MPNASEVQIVLEGSVDVTSAVIREQFGTVLNKYLSYARSINSFLDHLYGACHYPIEISVESLTPDPLRIAVPTLNIAPILS